MCLTKNQPRLRVLVALASYGDKNLDYLKRVIQTYQRLPHNVRIIVLSEAPKDLGSDIEVVVGLPAKNPWSLPFAHKAIFARELEKYDLFIYSEDDILFTQRNLEAFLRVTPNLAAEEIAGFLRYERDQGGRVRMVEVYGHFHWKPESVRQRGEFVVAQFTNDHSAFYLVTQTQLKRAIASGGFLQNPHEGLYDLLCSAATDPYTSCGFRKVICISALEDFLIHHMPNRYADGLCVSLDSFKEQVETLMRIRDGLQPARTLLAMDPKFWHFWWQKSYYEKPDREVLKMVPGDAKEILSIGCGWGATEAALSERGAESTALPLDSVIGAVAARRGVNVIYGTLQESLRNLNGHRFDCVVMTNLIHLHANPGYLLQQCSRFIGEGGSLVISGPNFNRIPWWTKRVLRIGDHWKLRSFDLSGINIYGPGKLARYLRTAGLRVAAVQWLNHEISRGPIRGNRVSFGSFTARDWVLRATR
jgi:SAM-dependent methyltransferase